MTPDGALFSPSVARNRGPLLEVLRRVLPEAGTVLEIASGTGEHAVHFAAALPRLTWQPTDIDAESLRSIDAHREAAHLPNLRAPLRLDVQRPDWPVERADGIVSINMIHIAPWSAAEGLMGGAGRVLRAGSALVLYGPFLEAGRDTAPSNLSFDENLKARDARWGIRRLDDVTRLAVANGLALRERIDMPANNLALLFIRT